MPWAYASLGRGLFVHQKFLFFYFLFLHMRYYQPIRFAAVFVYKDEISDIVFAAGLTKETTPKKKISEFRSLVHVPPILKEFWTRGTQKKRKTYELEEYIRINETTSNLGRSEYLFSVEFGKIRIKKKIKKMPQRRRWWCSLQLLRRKSGHGSLKNKKNLK